MSELARGTLRLSSFGAAPSAACGSLPRAAWWVEHFLNRGTPLARFSVGRKTDTSRAIVPTSRRRATNTNARCPQGRVLSSDVQDMACTPFRLPLPRMVTVRALPARDVSADWGKNSWTKRPGSEFVYSRRSCPHCKAENWEILTEGIGFQYNAATISGMWEFSPTPSDVRRTQVHKEPRR